ncbi:MAG: cyclophilin-like fold protein [Actinobacteria bacterium]|nr:cyclophilin-like fold protein [Actinomycetota bacterium]
MGADIRILLEHGELRARLDESPTALAVKNALPLEARANRWGDEVYFTIPVQVEEAPDARQDMRVGELGYWPVGAAFCIFFGPTPASIGSTPRAYSNVNPFGQIDAHESIAKGVLSGVKDGQLIRVVSE